MDNIDAPHISIGAVGPFRSRGGTVRVILCNARRRAAREPKRGGRDRTLTLETPLEAPAPNSRDDTSDVAGSVRSRCRAKAASLWTERRSKRRRFGPSVCGASGGVWTRRLLPRIKLATSHAHDIDGGADQEEPRARRGALRHARHLHDANKERMSFKAFKASCGRRVGI